MLLKFLQITHLQNIKVTLKYKFRFCQKDEGLAARLRTRMDFPFYEII